MIFLKKEGGGATAGQEVEGQEVGQVETEEPLGEDEPSTSKKPGNTNVAIHTWTVNYQNAKQALIRVWSDVIH